MAMFKRFLQCLDCILKLALYMFIVEHSFL